MSTIDYPSSLPLALLQGYGYDDKERFLRTQMDSGFARQRRRFTTGPTTFNVRFLFSQCNLETFEQFFEFILNDGVEIFNMCLSVGQGKAVEHEVRFIETFKVSGTENRYTVSAKIEAIEKAVAPVDAETFALFNLFGCAAEYALYIDAFAILVNVDYPASAMGA